MKIPPILIHLSISTSEREREREREKKKKKKKRIVLEGSMEQIGSLMQRQLKSDDVFR